MSLTGMPGDRGNDVTSLLERLMDNKALSRKLLVTIGTWLVTFLNDRFNWGLDHETIAHLVVLAVGYVLGQGAVDVAKALKKDAVQKA